MIHKLNTSKRIFGIMLENVLTHILTEFPQEYILLKVKSYPEVSDFLENRYIQLYLIIKENMAFIALC